MRFVFLFFVLIHSDAFAKDAPKDDGTTAIAEQCLKELDGKTQDAALIANVRQAFTPNIKADMQKTIMDNFGSAIEQGPPMKFKGTDVFVHVNDDTQKRFCAASGGPVAAYSIFEGKVGVFVCIPGKRQAALVDTFRHEAIHAVQYNLKPESVPTLNNLLKFDTPNGEDKMAEQLSAYTMPQDMAQNSNKNNNEFNDLYEKLAKEITGNSSEINAVLNPAGGGANSDLASLNSLGVIETVNADPLKLKWTPRFEGEGGEANYKKLLFARSQSKINCGPGQSDPMCNFLTFKNANCKKASTSAMVFECLKMYKNRTLVSIENIANSSAANKKAVAGMLGAVTKNSCFGIASFCTETQANSSNVLASMLRSLNAKKLGLSDVCQRFALDPYLSSAQGEATFNLHYKPLFQQYEREGWSALQKAAIKIKTDAIVMSYGSWAQSALSGYGNLNPSMCKKNPDPNSCLWHTPNGPGNDSNYDPTTTQIQ